MLFFDIDSYNSFHCLPFTHDVNTKGKHIFLKYGCEFPHSRIYLISTTHFHWFLIVVSLSASYLTSHPWQPLPLPSWLYGNITGRHLANAIRRCSEGLADYNLEFILCSLANIVSLSPMDAHGGGASRGSLSGLMDRSKKPKQTPGQTFHHTISAVGLSPVPVSNFLVLALILQRYYPWERTSNAGIRFSRCVKGDTIPPST